MLIWDNVNTHLDARMGTLIGTRPWLMVFYLPTYAPNLNLVETCDPISNSAWLPPARLAESARSSRFLSLLERQRIATLRAQGLVVRAIAERIGWQRSMIVLKDHGAVVVTDALHTPYVQAASRVPRRHPRTDHPCPHLLGEPGEDFTRPRFALREADE